MENIHIQFTKTYESKTKNRKTKESKQQFDLFDLALQENGKREAPKLRKYTICHRITRSMSKKNSSSSSDVNTSGVNEESGEQLTKGKDEASTKHTKKISPCGLFVNSPKKAKWTTHTRKKGTRKVSERINIYSCHRTSVKESVELLESTMMALKNTSRKRVSTPVLASPKYPSIEVFRDMRKQPLDWSLVHREAESSYVRTSLSLSDSFREGTEAASITDKEQPECSFSFRQPWAPTGVRQRSFVKIRTPAAVSHNASQSLQMEPVPGAVEDKGDDGNSSSYTSVYTWTTATGTITNTAQMGSEAETRPKGDNPGSRSPTLVLKSYLQENLHSTAIHPHHDICHLQQTPQVSPIKCVPGDEMRHRTPSAPTQNVSPRGPRKTHSFLSLPARSVPPKCSTMLFSSSMADSGDAPLDVSSIRMALSEAADVNEGANALTNHEPCRRVSIEPTQTDNFHLVDNILTSTPCRGGSEKLMWNLSSVQASSEEDELCPLQTSGNVVNSQEIMAATLSDASMNMSGDQAMQWRGTRPEVVLAEGPEHEPVGNPESGISPDSPLVNPVGNPESGISPDSPPVNPVGNPECDISPDSPPVNPVGNPESGISPDSPPVNPVGNPECDISPDSPPVNPVGNPESGISPDSPPVNPVGNPECDISPDSPPVNPVGNPESGISPDSPPVNPVGNPESGISPDSPPVNPVGNPECDISPDSPPVNPVGNLESGISPDSPPVNPVGNPECDISPDSPPVNPVGNPECDISPDSPPVNPVGNPESGISPDSPPVNPVGNPECDISPDSPPVNPVGNLESGISPDSPPVNPVGNPENGISPDSSPFTPIHFLRPDPTGPGYHGSPPTDFAATPAESPELAATRSPQLGGLFTEPLDFVYVQDQAFPGDGEVGGGDGLGGIGLDGCGLDGIGLDGSGLDGIGLDGVGLDGVGLDGLCFDGSGLDSSGLDGGGLDGRGDSCGKGSEVPDAGREAKSKPGGGSSPRKARQAPSGSEDVDMLCTSDSSYTYELSVDDRLYVYSPSKKKQVPEKRGLKKELLAERDDEVEDCPVSSLRYREGDTKRRPSRCPHLLLEVEPADSGFLDMVSTAPADIIGVVSEKFRPSVHSL